MYRSAFSGSIHLRLRHSREIFSGSRRRQKDRFSLGCFDSTFKDQKNSS
jgi:hypothetical protein